LLAPCIQSSDDGNLFFQILYLDAFLLRRLEIDCCSHSLRFQLEIEKKVSPFLIICSSFLRLLSSIHQAAVIGCALVESWQSSTNHQKISKKEEEKNSLWQARASKRNK